MKNGSLRNPGKETVSLRLVDDGLLPEGDRNAVEQDLALVPVPLGLLADGPPNGSQLRSMFFFCERYPICYLGDRVAVGVDL